MAAIYLASIRQRLFESENMNLQRIIDQVRSLKDAQRNAEKFRTLNRDVEAIKFYYFRFQLFLKFYASEFASASSSSEFVASASSSG